MVANGVDTELFRPDPAGERDEQEVLCVGRASDPNKGVASLVEALALLSPGLRLTLVDDDHPPGIHPLFKCLDGRGRIGGTDLIRVAPRHLSPGTYGRRCHLRQLRFRL